LGASSLVVNVLAGVTCLACLGLFVKISTRSREFKRITDAMLDPKSNGRAPTLDALQAWIETGTAKDGGGSEVAGETAEVALALTVSGRLDEADVLLAREFAPSLLSSAERARLVGARALAYQLAGKDEIARAAMTEERSAVHDFVSQPYAKAYAALIDALCGDGAHALETLGDAGARPGEPCVARWARAHALAASDRPNEAMNLLRRQRAVHGDGGLVPVVNVPGPASALASEILSQAH
jgi:hypothetical protein